VRSTVHRQPWRYSQLIDVALATCSLLPDLDDDERLLIPELASRGLIAEPRVWDDPSVSWDAFRAVVVRSTWDYSDRHAAFLAWCARPRLLLNTLPVITWNTDKRYLRELSGAGIPVVPTTWFDPGTVDGQVHIPDGDVVVKPSVSSGARNTSRYRPADRDQARAHVARLLATGRTVLVQRYVESVDTDGEIGLIFIEGVFSHAVRKGPILRIHGVATDQLWAPEDIAPRVPDASERAVAEQTLDALPWPPKELVYARVDLVRGDGGAPQVLELELAEPSLFLGYAADAPGRLAAAIARRVNDAAP
jgi:glutathione synthase/RimK-type ligase-like ATP-grasp enzyme